MKINRKRIFLLITAIIIILAIVFREMIAYGYMQAKGQYEVLSKAQPVEEFLSSENFPDSLKAKIRLIQEVRRYAIDSLGLNNSDNYTTLYDQKGKDILWSLSAVEKYKMISKEWSFPFLGTFSYKGFFDLEKAKTERQILTDQGLDARVRPVGGWSTLGWFKDPILSNMLYRKDGQLAELIIHELTHSTLYIKDSVAFNENLATFIGEKGAIKFISQKYGQNSEVMQEYLQSFIDYDNYGNHMLNGYRKLDSLYNSSSFQSIEELEKSKIKKEVIQEIIQNLDTINYSNKKVFKRIFSKGLPNNAYFMSFQRYRSKQGLFDEEYEQKFNGEIEALIKYYAKNFPSL